MVLVIYLHSWSELPDNNATAFETVRNHLLPHCQAPPLVGQLIFQKVVKQTRVTQLNDERPLASARHTSGLRNPGSL